MLTTTQHWNNDWLDVNNYDGQELILTLKALKVDSGLISIKVEDRVGNSKIVELPIEIIEIADFVEDISIKKLTISEANSFCIDSAGRLPTEKELYDTYVVVDNPLVTNKKLWTSGTRNGEGYDYVLLEGKYWSFGTSSAHAYVHCVKVKTPITDTNLVTVKLNSGWNNVALSPMTLEKLIEKIGAENLLIVQGALPQSSYRKLFVDQGRPYLNSFKKTEFGQAYWIKVKEAVEFTYSRVKYSETQEITLNAGWNNVASLYTLTLEEIQEQLGINNVLIIQGALPQSSYRKLFVDQNRPYLNSFKKFELNQGYWVKLDHEAKLIFEFNLSEIAKDNSNNNLIRTEIINSTEYTIKLFSDSQPQTETTNGTIIVFGSLNGMNITMSLNSSYPSDAKFQIAIFDSNGDEVTRSEIVDFENDAIDFGSLSL